MATVPINDVKLALTIGYSLEGQKVKWTWFAVFNILPVCLLKVPVFSKLAFF
jgi:hypothetical protein